MALLHMRLLVVRVYLAADRDRELVQVQCASD